MPLLQSSGPDSHLVVKVDDDWLVDRCDVCLQTGDDALSNRIHEVEPYGDRSDDRVHLISERQSCQHGLIRVLKDREAYLSPLIRQSMSSVGSLCGDAGRLCFSITLHLARLRDA